MRLMKESKDAKRLMKIDLEENRFKHFLSFVKSFNDFNMRDYQYTPLLWDYELRAMVWYPEKEPCMKENDMAFYNTLAKLPQQSHSLNVGIVDHMRTPFLNTDALVTFNPEIPLGVVTADCVPILLYAGDVKGIAAVHAGWKGSLGGILDRTIDVLISRGADPENITAIFGPSISMENYEVDRELADRFCDAGFSECVHWPNGPEVKPHLDLQEVNRLRLLRKGLRPGNIYTCSLCTFGSYKMQDGPTLQSYRRDGAKAGRNLTVINMVARENTTA